MIATRVVTTSWPSHRASRDVSFPRRLLSAKANTPISTGKGYTAFEEAMPSVPCCAHHWVTALIVTKRPIAPEQKAFSDLIPVEAGDIERRR